MSRLSYILLFSLLLLASCSKRTYIDTQTAITQDIANETKTISKNDLLIEKWLGESRNIEVIDEKRKNELKSQLVKNCIRIEDDICSLKLECIPAINHYVLDINYSKISNNMSSKEAEDPLNYLVSNKEGHWLSYTFFFEAEYRFLLEQCQNNASSLILKSWYDDENPYKYERNELDNLTITGTYVSENYWLNYGLNWSYPDVSALEINTTYLYPVIVCGNWHKRFFDKMNGPCGIALTQSEVNGINEFNKLDKTLIFDPYLGSVSGGINDGHTFVYILDKKNHQDYLDGEFSDIESHIFLIMTDEMIYGFSDNKAEWVDYYQFLIDKWKDWLSDQMDNLELGF